MISINLTRILTWPFRLIAKIFRGGSKGSALRTTAKSGGSVVAKSAGHDVLTEEYREEPPSGIEAAMFKQLPRPRLTEKSASDMTLDQAQHYAEQASRFYHFRFPLFPRGDFFYEEIEEEYLNSALGYEACSIDRRFVDVATLFRRTLNANTRRLLLYWAPMIGVIVFTAAYFLSSRAPILGIENAQTQAAITFGGAALIASFLAFLIYSWPYKVVQQRNLMNLDNYVTSKFARINNNFQVAKRRALNVERDKRMSERDELRDEAGAWTLSYHWFATRLFLCETMLRNKFYQVRRNTTLYWVAGLVGVLFALAGAEVALYLSGAASFTLIGLAAGGAIYVFLSWLIMARATGMMFGVLEANEWSRFHILNLDATIRDHVGEDKLQIVTFRDRNRFE
ncbi:MAG: hypothetical protein DHS20C05_09380 [Hyphococcus sp.]|nr:MAG: hypothetical protein DHS20C05_09380 [Marinicaulis sp.]